MLVKLVIAGGSYQLFSGPVCAYSGGKSDSQQTVNARRLPYVSSLLNIVMWVLVMAEGGHFTVRSVIIIVIGPRGLRRQENPANCQDLYAR